MKHQQTAVHTPHTSAETKKPVRSVKKGNDPAASAPTDDGNGHGRDEMIRQTAYFLYEARSRESGHELADWLQAEAQLASKSGKDSSAAQAI